MRCGIPVLTIGSGPANSVRGAAFLTGSSDSLVIDVGGTSTDVGVLVNGFPRGVVAGRGDRWHPDQLPDARPGHDRARRRHGGHAGPRRGAARPAQCRLSAHEPGPGLRRDHADADRERGRGGPGGPGRSRRTSRYRRLLAGRWPVPTSCSPKAIDRVKTSKEDRALVAVGGGSILVPDHIPGISEVIRPDTSTPPTPWELPLPRSAAQVDRIFHLGPEGPAGGPRRGARRGARARGRGGRRPRHGDRSSSWRSSPWPTSPLQPIRVRAKAVGALGGLDRHQLGADCSGRRRLAGAAEQAT